MIRLSKNKCLENYNIDVNGVITDNNGVIQKTKIKDNRPIFKGYYLHRIQMYTNYGYKANYVIHHIDKNPFNNKLDNLVYMTRSEHISLHKKGNKNTLGKHFNHTEETKKKMRKAAKGKRLGEANPFYNKHHTEETKKKISESCKGRNLGKPTWNKGKKLSKEIRHKISVGLNAYYASKK